jgi:hypothetical protein
VDQEVAKTLGDLELKLAQLEHELTSIGRRETPTQATDPGTRQTEPSTRQTTWQTSTPVERASTPEATTSGGGRLVDEAIESNPLQHGFVAEEIKPNPLQHRFVAEEHPPLEPPRPFSEERQSIDIADLVRFRDKLARTMDELIDEYSRLLSLQPPGQARDPDA